MLAVDLDQIVRASSSVARYIFLYAACPVTSVMTTAFSSLVMLDVITFTFSRMSSAVTVHSKG